MDLVATVLNGKTLRVLAYLLAGSLAFAAAVRSARTSGGRERLAPAFWGSAGLLLILLAVSREVDVASQIAEIGRNVFRTEGWYADRRPIQKLAILGVVGAAACVGVVGSGLLLLRGRRQLLFGFVAMVGLGTFLAVRAVSWHDIDAVLYRRSIDEVQINALAELLATMVAGLAAGVAVFAPANHDERSGG